MTGASDDWSVTDQDQKYFPLGGNTGQNTPPPSPQLEKTHDPHFLLGPTVVPTQNLHNSRIANT